MPDCQRRASMLQCPTPSAEYFPCHTKVSFFIFNVWYNNLTVLLRLLFSPSSAQSLNLNSQYSYQILVDIFLSFKKRFKYLPVPNCTCSGMNTRTALVSNFSSCVTTADETETQFKCKKTNRKPSVFYLLGFS